VEKEQRKNSALLPRSKSQLFDAVVDLEWPEQGIRERTQWANLTPSRAGLVNKILTVRAFGRLLQEPALRTPQNLRD
jgi:hypothetical protein